MRAARSGAALFAWHQLLGNEREADGVHDSQRGSYLGPEFSREEIHAYLTTNNIPFTELSDAEMPERIADLIKAEKVIGWFQGRMEFGPRALGGRIHHRRRAIAEDAGGDEPQDQVPREFPALCAERAARESCRVVRL